MDDASTLERRRAERAELTITVELRDARGFSLHPSKDISVGGFFFDRAIPHAVGSHVELAFTLPGELETIRCMGEVVNVPDANAYGMGVRFINLKAVHRQQLERFLNEPRRG
ncbi:MAG: PilZ domain-containing protein [Myxococcaceae bacterium]|nr:PilZ domain-containing protein [Myxococcaceae bacterium]